MHVAMTYDQLLAIGVEPATVTLDRRLQPFECRNIQFGAALVEHDVEPPPRERRRQGQRNIRGERQR